MKKKFYENNSLLHSFDRMRAIIAEEIYTQKESKIVNALKG